MITEFVSLPCRPAAGLIPRGVTGSQRGSQTLWSVSRGDLIQAHRLHISAAQQLRGLPVATQYLQAAAECRQLLAAPQRFNVYSPGGRRIQGLLTRTEAHKLIQALEPSTNYAGWTLHTAEEH